MANAQKIVAYVDRQSLGYWREREILQPLYFENSGNFSVVWRPCFTRLMYDSVLLFCLLVACIWAYWKRKEDVSVRKKWFPWNVCSGRDYEVFQSPEKWSRAKDNTGNVLSTQLLSCPQACSEYWLPVVIASPLQSMALAWMGSISPGR